MVYRCLPGPWISAGDLTSDPDFIRRPKVLCSRSEAKPGEQVKDGDGRRLVVCVVLVVCSVLV
jgi:hypothetical protein